MPKQKCFAFFYNEAAKSPIIVVTIMNTIIPIILKTIPEVAKESPLITTSDFESLIFVFMPIIHPIIQKNIPTKFNMGIKLSMNPIMPTMKVAIAKSSFFMNKHLY
jgi:hypothetical protein